MSKHTVRPDAGGISLARGRKATIDRRVAPTRVGLVCPAVSGVKTSRSPEARLAEFEGLARAIRLEIVFSEIVNLREIRPATFIGGGTVERIKARVEAEKLELVLLDTQLSPSQQRNLERATGAKVLDRTALILEIFGERAATREGVLQVELAHLTYQKGRLVRSWTHLERQRGSTSFIGGPGETQMESDRRLLEEKILVLKERIEKITRSRNEQRKSRRAEPFPMIALVGYTNSGKSTLFNRLTGAGVVVKDLLFATLDTTVRRAKLPRGREVVFSDTVGFVSDLPTDLIAAFRGTLAEVIDARIVLHVRDIASVQSAAEATDVEAILKHLGVEPSTTAFIEVWNKIDLLPEAKRVSMRAEAATGRNGIVVCPLSAATGEGADALLLAVENILALSSRTYSVVLPSGDGKRIHWLYENGEVLETVPAGDFETRYEVRIGPTRKQQFLSLFEGNIAGGGA
ncbi:MAG: GTPase HflX [Cucumibacter sp.]